MWWLISPVWQGLGSPRRKTDGLVREGVPTLGWPSWRVSSKRGQHHSTEGKSELSASSYLSACWLQTPPHTAVAPSSLPSLHPDPELEQTLPSLVAFARHWLTAVRKVTGTLSDTHWGKRDGILHTKPNRHISLMSKFTLTFNNRW